MLNDNSKKPRTLINIIGIPFIIFSIYIGSVWFILLMLFALYICIKELSAMVLIEGYCIHEKVFYTFIILFLFHLNLFPENISSVVNTFLIFDFFELNILIYSAIMFLILELSRRKNKFDVNNFLLNIFSINWIFLGILSIIKIRFIDSSIWTAFSLNVGFYYIIIMFLSIWSCDSFAFIFGSKFGKKKIFPKTSPKKTWLGAFSGFIFTLLFLYFVLLLNDIFNFKINFTYYEVIFLSLIFGVISQFGDYIESYIKRKFNVKDSGTILQGHGGMLDRLDSLILVAPFFVLYLMFIEGFVIL